MNLFFEADTTKVPRTLLLADDSVTIQRVIELTFADEDIQVVAVSDGDQAIERLESSPPDIVLADVGMPGKTGYEVAEYIKQSPKLAHIPVVLLTGAFEPVDQDKAARAGCDCVLAKPFEPQLVIGRVKELLARPRQSALDVPLAPPAVATSEWASPIDPFAAMTSEPAQPPSMNDYFDRLDAAFANLSGPPSRESKLIPPPPGLAEQIDWFGTKSEPSPSDLWLVSEQPKVELKQSPTPETSVPAPVPVLQQQQPVAPLAAPPTPEPTVAPPSIPDATLPALPVLPPLAEAFALLLAAEQNQPPPSTAPVWPTPGAIDLEALADQVTRRVLDQITDRVVRESVADVVSTVAERLVRDEIERIKSSIK